MCWLFPDWHENITDFILVSSTLVSVDIETDRGVTQYVQHVCIKHTDFNISAWFLFPFDLEKQP